MLFKKKTKEPMPDFSEVKVTLKPWGKIQPGTYLTVIYGFIFLLILFFILLFPGLINPGTYVTFKTPPHRAGVWIDGEKAGVTPCEIFIPGGEHQITIKRPFYKDISFRQVFGSRLFGTLFFPLKKEINKNLQIDDMEDLLKNALDDYTQWAMIKEFSAEYQMPKILLDTAKSIYATDNAEDQQKIMNFLHNALYYTHTDFTAVELMLSALIVQSGGKLITYLDLQEVLNDFIILAKKFKNLPLWLYSLLPEGTGEESEPVYLTQQWLLSTNWFQDYLKEYQNILSNFKTQQDTYPVPNNRLSIKNVAFVPIPAGQFLMGKYTAGINLTSKDTLDNLPHPVDVKAFFMTQDEISNSQFKAFIEQNSMWKPSNRQELVAAGKATKYYLIEWENDEFRAGSGDLPVVNISFYAAQAYCAWLSREAKTRFPTYYVRLPFQAEWEWAAWQDKAISGHPGQSVFHFENIAGPEKTGTSLPNAFGLRDTSGNVWEWCNDWYSPVSYLFTTWQAQEYDYRISNTIPSGSLKVVRGGAWANLKAEILPYTRGSQPAFWCTPYLGFRVVLAEH